MAERSHPTSNGNTMSHGASRGPAINPRGSATLAGVRRNLFQSQGIPQAPTRALRRPAAAPSTASPLASNTNNNDENETVRPDADAQPNSDATGIVVRDRHGEIEWGEPPSPDLDDQGELPLESQREEVERGFPATSDCVSTEANLGVTEERLRLSEAVKSHQINSSAMSDQPEGELRFQSYVGLDANLD